MGKRSIIIFTFICILFGVLTIRLSVLAGSEYLNDVSKGQASYKITVSQTRANIYDKNLYKLVNEEVENKITFLPTSNNIDNILEEIGLDNRGMVVKAMKLQKPLMLNTNKNKFYNKNIELFEVIKRYSNDQLASHIIGYVDATQNGVTGIEKSQNEFLSQYGNTTEISYYKNGIGETMPGARTEKEISDKITEGVVLTIDKGIQKIVENVGSKYIKKGAVVVMDPYTGKLVASASFPNYDYNDIAKSIKDEENSPMINRVLGPYSVGSTFKIAVAASAIESGISKDYKVMCNGYINVKGQIFKCHDERGHGLINMEQALVMSCNPYFIDLAQKMSSDKLLSISGLLGFGKEYNLDSGIIAQKGTLPSKLDLLNPAEVANLSFGQGKLSGTPIQVAQMMSSIVNGGKTPSPMLINGFTLDGKELYKKGQVAAHMISMNATTANQLKQMLINGIANRSNQYAKPRLTTAGGKTSTAQTGKISEDREVLNVWFAGFFPAENPKYVAVVLVEDGKSGNESAGPVFSDIADQITVSEKNVE